jgi:hypothetical protein
MKKLFHYIEPIWLGEDGKVSGKSLFAIIFSIHFLYNVDRSINVLHTVIKSKIDAPSIAAMSGVLANAGIILGLEMTAIIAFWGLKAYSNYKTDLINKNCAPDSTT